MTGKKQNLHIKIERNFERFYNMSNEYIKKSEAIKVLSENHSKPFIANTIRAVENLPAASVEAVIKCGECVYKKIQNGVMYCDYPLKIILEDVKPDHFCGYGKRSYNNG